MIEPKTCKYLKSGSIESRNGEVVNYAVNIERALQVLGWKPMTGLWQGLREIFDNYKSQIGLRIPTIVDHA